MEISFRSFFSWILRKKIINKGWMSFEKKSENWVSHLIANYGINRAFWIRTFPEGKCMFRQYGTGLPLLRKVMNHLPLIRKSLCKKNSLHVAELFLSSRPSNSSPSELNIRLLKQKAKRKAIHQSELYLASKCRTSSPQLNSHLAKKGAIEKAVLCTNHINNEINFSYDDY